MTFRELFEKTIAKRCELLKDEPIIKFIDQLPGSVSKEDFFASLTEELLETFDNLGEDTLMELVLAFVTEKNTMKSISEIKDINKKNSNVS